MHGEYWDDFSTIVLDIDGDGRLDVITGGWWGETLRWRRNPGDAKKTWDEQVIATVGNIETTRAWDLDGDGVIEIVPNTPGRREVKAFRLQRDAQRLAQCAQLIDLMLQHQLAHAALALVRFEVGAQLRALGQRLLKTHIADSSAFVCRQRVLGY
jgi:hypothetical protein